MFQFERGVEQRPIADPSERMIAERPGAQWSSEQGLAVIAELTRALRGVNRRDLVIALTLTHVAGMLRAAEVRLALLDLASGALLDDQDHTIGNGAPLAGEARLIADGMLLGSLQLYRVARLGLSERRALQLAADVAASAIHRATLQERLEYSEATLVDAYEMSIDGWARALDMREHACEGHSRRVSELSTQLGRRMGLSSDTLVHLRRGALLHDIGKMGVPDAILHKPGPLSDTEWAVVRQHPVYAHELLAPIVFLQRSLSIPRYHHERWDGSGYPFGLRGEEIPLGARIFAVIDAWDAMTSNRPYRVALPLESAIAELTAGAGSQFDPIVSRAFVGMISR
jgi:HD-GYP domain-containing protein (c-di-GMP phosphodiesterase class II)